MRLMFIVTVCFGVLCMAVVIATSMFNARVRGDSPVSPWMRRVRQFQNEQQNAGWRIQMIPCDDPSRPMTMDLSGVADLVPLAGAFGFIIGAGMATYDRKYTARGALIGVTSLLVMFAGLWLKTRLQKQGWEVAPGHCIDRELRKIWIPAIAGSGGGQWTWLWRVVCDYEYLSVHYRATPEVRATGFDSEEAAREFLAGRVFPDGTCTLRVDPENPRRTELFDHCEIGEDAL